MLLKLSGVVTARRQHAAQLLQGCTCFFSMYGGVMVEKKLLASSSPT